MLTAIIFGSVFVCLAITVAVMVRASRPLTVAQARISLETMMTRIRGRNPELNGAGLYVSAPARGIDDGFGADATGHTTGVSPRFHAASVGKLFTASLIGRLVDRGLLRPETRIRDILSAETLSGLFAYQGRDYCNEVTVDHLLSHTSGAADYFGDPGPDGRSLMHTIAVETDTEWTPQSLLEYARGQPAIARPGDRFHYSDTGFILLGLLVEAVEGLPFHTILHRDVFAPLAMNDSYMPGRSRPLNADAEALRPCWVNGKDLSGSKSISVDWAGGGVATTATDLIAFHRALQNGDLVSQGTLEWLGDCHNRFRQGIRYGRGMMQLRFGEFFPLLKSWPHMNGHMGVLGCQLFHDPAENLHVLVYLGSTRFMPLSVQALIQVVGIVRRIPARLYSAPTL